MILQFQQIIWVDMTFINTFIIHSYTYNWIHVDVFHNFQTKINVLKTCLSLDNTTEIMKIKPSQTERKPIYIISTDHKNDNLNIQQIKVILPCIVFGFYSFRRIISVAWIKTKNGCISYKKSWRKSLTHQSVANM